VSGLVVIPTVEHDSGLHRVSVAINVGQSRAGSPPAEVVTREDLVVELRHPAEGSFEPIASPDPGPLPVRALRVIQARGEFTFAQGVNLPDELRITLRGDQKSFPMSQTLTPGGCLKREPQKGDPFPRRRPGLTLLRPFKRARCCLQRLDAPLNTSTDAAAKRESFEMEADFQASGRRCRCGCCQYRQYVRGTFTDGAGAPVRFDLPSGPLDPTAWCEDGSFDEFGPGRHGFYGRRPTSSPGDEYDGAGKAQGCSYRGSTAPSCPPADTLHLEFLGLIVDTCQARVITTEKWVVDL
jgi:hypothetical protein